MKIFEFIASGLLIMSNLNAQNDNDWILKYDSIDHCGYADTNGNIMIPFGKYSMCYTDTFKTYAIVFMDEQGFFGIDKNENRLFTVFPYDNGPDYISEGTFRIIDNSKMGFADTTGKIIIQPIYDFVFGFDKGLALVNIHGHREKTDPADPNCEYHTWSGGKWGVIDKSGKLILEIKYDYKRNPVTQKIELTGNGEKYLIENGEIKRINK